jgi:hypothetical protein
MIKAGGKKSRFTVSSKSREFGNNIFAKSGIWIRLLRKVRFLYVIATGYPSGAQPASFDENAGLLKKNLLAFFPVKC